MILPTLYRYVREDSTVKREKVCFIEGKIGVGNKFACAEFKSQLQTFALLKILGQRKLGYCALQTPIHACS
jgi:hypothetical protein